MFSFSLEINCLTRSPTLLQSQAPTHNPTVSFIDPPTSAPANLPTLSPVGNSSTSSVFSCGGTLNVTPNPNEPTNIFSIDADLSGLTPVDLQAVSLSINSSSEPTVASVTIDVVGISIPIAITDPIKIKIGALPVVPLRIIIEFSGNQLLSFQVTLNCPRIRLFDIPPRFVAPSCPDIPTDNLFARYEASTFTNGSTGYIWSDTSSNGRDLIGNIPFGCNDLTVTEYDIACKWNIPN
eukprot:CAMPEP_0114697968 /NCGR_PEP_ID=MMETSP0191-20121206/74365_1 /TAXON_ID=126664 /ORGANISM="Sorites sp." /LENGTH=236 /DNA_ID=CAMNT_0001997695 /DNA_START=876 /DNA_END=1587 /DNA_ORIENTATION=+